MKQTRFIIAGERRSGTSSLSMYLKTHPKIFLHPDLDSAYFLDDELRGTRVYKEAHTNLSDWSLSHTREEYEKIIHSDLMIIGEKSADYLHWNPCLNRINGFYPDMKLVLCLRNPVDRAWSHYWNEVGKRREWLTFEEALESENERIASSDYANVHLSYRTRGIYIKNIEYLLKLFPKEQLFVVILEKLVKSPNDSLSKLYEFLGADPSLGLENAGKRYNQNWTTLPRKFWTLNRPLVSIESTVNTLIKRAGRKVIRKDHLRKKYIPFIESLTRKRQQQVSMDTDTRSDLLKFYYPTNRHLESLLGFKIDEWNA